MIGAIERYIRSLHPHNYEEIINKICKIISRLKLNNEGRFLDIGCWDGCITTRFADSVNMENIWGVDFSEKKLAEASNLINVKKINLEKDEFPFPDNYFDLVICNQVFEHLKVIWLPMSEIYRILKPNKYLCISVPNLSSLHNRLMLLFGFQPTCIRIMDGDHVRAFSARAFFNFVSFNNLFKIVGFYGSGFYPFKGHLSRILSKIFPRLSHTIIIIAKKNVKYPENPDWLEYFLKTPNEDRQTYYFD